MKLCVHVTRSYKAQGFTLLEVICSLGILSIICSSAMVIMSRNRQSSYNVTMQLRALEVARENMERILVADQVEEVTEYGASERYPAIEWENTVETFYSPLEGQTWARARCIARYQDMDDNEQSVELEHWLCKVSQEDMDDLERLENGDSLLFETINEAADYIGASEEDIIAWIENGMVQTQEGYFILSNLELYQRTNGDPSIEEQDLQATTGLFQDQLDEMMDDTDMGEDFQTELEQDQMDSRRMGR